MMTGQQVSALHVGDEIVNDKYRVTRKVVRIKKGHSIILTPKMRGHGKTARVSTTQVAQSHSLPPTVLVPEKAAGSLSKKDVRTSGDETYDDLFRTIEKLNSFHKAGLIPQCPPRVEAYFDLLEALLGEVGHASRD